jgi:D-methionine transport system substrate-binding protein
MKTLRIVVAAAAALLAATAAQAETLKVGVSAGPYAEILDFAGKIYQQREGIEVKVIEFADFTLPNAALAQGDLDFNNFQHKPYLDNQVKTRGWDLVAVEKSIIVPLGLYSKKITALSEVKEGSLVAIPNDPSNGSRALLLLQQAGLIKVDPAKGGAASIADIIDNPKKLKFREIDAAQLPRSLDDTDFSAITLNYAVSGGLDPKKSLLLEDANTPWNLWFIYRSPEVKAFILKRFEGTIIPTW